MIIKETFQIIVPVVQCKYIKIDCRPAEIELKFNIIPNG